MKKFLAVSVGLALGIFVQTPAGAQSFTVNSGQTVTAAQTLSAGQTGTVDSGGTLNVASSKNAIAVQGTSTITNSGIIEQTGSARAIRDTGTDIGLALTVTNNVGATISAVADDAIEIQFGDDSVVFDNSGLVIAAGSGDQAINFNHITSASNTLSNHSTGQIQTTAADAVRPGVNGVVNNDGLIKVTTPAGDTSSSDGVDAQTNSGITISNTVIAGDALDAVGTIEGERHGITGGNTAETGNPIGLFTLSVSNAASFTIQGDNGSGINIDGVGVNATTGLYDISGTDPDVTSNEMVLITNAGSIIGNGVSRDGDGVDVDGLVQISNSGTIRSQCAAGDTSEGVTVGGGIITNLAGGLIEGDNTAGKFGCNPVLDSITGTGRGITLAGVDHDVNNNDAPIVPTQAIYGFTTVDNFGKIFGDTDAGIALTGASSQYVVTIINEAGGTIEGAGQTQPAINTGANQASVINSGTITADNSGVAISLGAGDGTHTNTLQIFGGAAQVNGDIAGSSGSSSTLTIVPNATFTYTANETYSFNASTGTGAIAITGTQNQFTYAGALSNFTGVEFGSGTTTLTASSRSTYTGNSIVDSSALLELDGSLASAQILVAGTLLGNGSANGAVEIQAGGNIHPGDVAGDTAQLSTGALTMDSASTATFDLGAASGSADQIQSTGVVTIASSANLAINLPASPLPGDYLLLSSTSIAGNFPAPTFSPALPASLTADIVYTDTTVTLQLHTLSSVALQSSPNPASFGQGVTFIASVTGSSPGGMVTFMDGATTLGSGTVSGGVATFATSNLSVGWHDMSAVYAGDADNTSSTSSVLEQQITPATSHVALASALNPSNFGLAVIFTATVTGQSPTGTVMFDDGSTPICSGVALSSGVAVCTYSSLSVGAHAITAMYSGDTDNLAASSFGIVQTIQRAPSTATLSSACQSTFVGGQPFTLSATVTGVSPTGSVNFVAGTNNLCSSVALIAGSATCTTTALIASGTDTEQTFDLIANYLGDSNNAASSSAAVVVTALNAGDVVYRNGFEAESVTCPIE